VPEEEERITLETVKLAVQLGSDVNVATDTGETALHMAASRGEVSVVQFLIANGSDVNAKNRDGETPLHNAAYRGRDLVIPLLIRGGADLAAKNTKGETPLAKTALGVRPVSAVFVPDSQLRKTADVLRQLGATD
jgi:ankyrin repeat protein